MKISFRCDTTYFRQCMRRPIGGATTVGRVWQAISLCALASSLLVAGALLKSVSTCCFAFAILGVAFMMILPQEA